jgi:hypothetical protein
LDPNRVLDVILESFENNPDLYQTFISLLKKYNCERETLCNIIGFKYQALHVIAWRVPVRDHIGYDSPANFFLKTENMANPSEAQNIDSLHLVTSYLLKNDLIDLDTLLPHVSYKRFSKHRVKTQSV